MTEKLAVGFVVFFVLFAFIMIYPDFFSKDFDGKDFNKWKLVNITKTNSSESGEIHYSQHEGNHTRMKIFFGEYTSGGLFSDSKPRTKDYFQYDPNWNFTRGEKVIVVTEDHKGICINTQDRNMTGSYLFSFIDKDFIDTCYSLEDRTFVVLDK